MDNRLPDKRPSNHGGPTSNKAKREWARRVRAAVLIRLGGVCQWPGCNWTDSRALQIDHLNGGGTKENKKLGGLGIQIKILRMERPETEYQLLCANHNQIKKIENNEVPKQT